MYLCNDFYYLDFPELMDTEILYSKYGWLLMSKHEVMLFFFNPSTKKKIELPHTNASFSSICFTSPPTSSCYIVFGILYTSLLNEIHFSFIKVGDEERESHTSDLGSEHFWRSTCPLVFLNGVYYCLDCTFGNIMMFDLTKDKYELIKLPPIAHKRYMVEVDGDVWGVFVTSNERQVSVQKLNLSEKRWIKLESLGNKCLYISKNGSFAKTCVVNGMANKIYFNKFYGKSGVMYSLTTRMHHVVDGGFASKKAYGLTEAEYGVWIKSTLDQM
ncbi:hypothetical protein CDL12_01349 [Handroanthus impetiginosus]|uniref:KIB1-4 beta-propeller domain-containing protein n=1 Tax=Handroanthus impetiginosus TaxID=429701 RepID=A0A2G9I850_9LAMI|nr:hypothetical protein CDL12_01349 [Handroanthus impetiginosus]